MDSTPRVALVTGSGKRRLGSHVVDAFAERGYAIAVHFHSSASEAAETVARLRERGVAAEAFGADLRDESAVRALVDGVHKRFGRLDVVVNTAAIWQRRRLEEITADDVRRNFEVNVLGTFLVSQHAGLLMVGQPEGGCIITFSDWAVARPYPDFAAYFASKGAIPALTSCLAVELGTRNPRIRVNAIVPGPVMMPPDLPLKERQEAIAATLVKHEGSPGNVAQAVLYLIENDFVTGTCLTVDGGRTIYAGNS